MKSMLYIPLLMLSAQLNAAPLIFMTGERLLTYCQNQDIDSRDRGICDGFLAGMADSATTIQSLNAGYVNVCINDSASPFQLRNAFLRLAERQPAQLKHAASSMVLAILASDYPCKK